MPSQVSKGEYPKNQGRTKMSVYLIAAFNFAARRVLRFDKAFG